MPLTNADKQAAAPFLEPLVPFLQHMAEDAQHRLLMSDDQRDDDELRGQIKTLKGLIALAGAFTKPSPTEVLDEQEKKEDAARRSKRPVRGTAFRKLPARSGGDGL